MIKSVKLSSLLLLFLLLSTYYPTYKIPGKNFIFTIKNIEVENNKILDSKDILKELENLKGKSLLSIDKEIIKFAMNKFDFVSSFEVKKIYPATIKVKIFEKKLTGVYNIGSGKGMTIKDFINKKIDEKKTIIDYKKPNSLIANIKKLERKIGKKNV